MSGKNIFCVFNLFVIEEGGIIISIMQILLEDDMFLILGVIVEVLEEDVFSEGEEEILEEKEYIG